MHRCKINVRYLNIISISISISINKRIRISNIIIIITSIIKTYNSVQKQSLEGKYLLFRGSTKIKIVVDHHHRYYCKIIN